MPLLIYVSLSFLTIFFFIPDSPVFLNAPADVLGDAGERVRLGCSVSSNPPPTYTWTKDDLVEVSSTSDRATSFCCIKELILCIRVL